MRIIRVEAGRWQVELGGGLVLEVLLACGVSAGFWRWRGELVAEAEADEA